MRYFGMIGFARTIETEPDIWENVIQEKPYYGDSLNHRFGWQQSSDKKNDDLTINVSLSILADEFMYCNLAAMKYATYMGTKWKIVSATPERPRINLELGGEWHGDEA